MHRTGLAIPRSFLRVNETTHGEPFSPADVRPLLDRLTYLELSRLVRLGWLFRLSRGRYATVDPLVRVTPGAEEALRPFQNLCFYPVLYRTLGGILRTFSGRLLGVLLFGSAARRAVRPMSDIDLAVVTSDVGERDLLDAREARSAERPAGSLVVEEWDTLRHYHVPSVLVLPRDAFGQPGRAMLGVVSDGILLIDTRGTVLDEMDRLRRRFREAGVKEYRLGDGRPFWETGTLFDEASA